MRINFIKKLRGIDYVLILVALLLFFYTVTRVFSLSLTHDESFTFLNHVQLSLKDIYLYNGPAPANNHLLNTVLIKIFSNILGESEFVLRIPALIGHILFLLSSFLITKKFKNPILRICSFLLLNLNLFVLDFFSLARGYGLALGFTMLSIYFLVKLFNSKKIDEKIVFFSSLTVGISVLASFSFLNFYLALIGVLFLLSIYKIYLSGKCSSFAKFVKLLILKNKFLFLNTFLLLAIIAFPVLKIRRAGWLFYGGEKSFWEDTVVSLIRSSLYGKTISPNIFSFIEVIIGLLFVGSCLLFLYKGIWGREKEKLSLGVLLLIVISALSTIVQNWIFGTKFLIDRTAIFFIPLFTLIVIYFFKLLAISKSSYVKLLTIICTILITILSVWHFVRFANNSYCTNWKEGASSREAINDIRKYYNSSDTDSLKLGTDWYLVPSVEYYKRIYKLEWLEIETEEDNSDYYYLSPLSKEYYEVEELNIVKEYEVSGSKMLKR